MASSSESFRLLIPEIQDESKKRRATRNLRLIAVGLGVAAAVLSAVIGVFSYRISYQLQLDTLIRTNVTLAQHLASYSSLNASDDPLDWIETSWRLSPHEDNSMFVCVVSREGTLLVNTKRPEKVGSDVSHVVLPATASRPATTVGRLAAERGEWFGENTSASGNRQLAAYEYSPTIDSLVVVHTPSHSYRAKVLQAILPWVIGFVASTLLMWPLALLLLNFAFDRAHSRADQAEQVRQDSEQLFETIFDQAAIGVAIIHSKTGRFARINGRYESLVGYTNQEIKSKTWQQITHPDDLQSELERMKKLNQGRISEFELEKRLIRADGATIWVNLTVSPTWHRGESGEFHIAVIEDITARRQSSLELSASENRFRTLVEHAPDAIVVLDVDQQRFVDFNENALTLFCLSREEMLERNPIDLSPEFQPDGRRSREAAEKIIADALAGQSPQVEWTHCDSQGNELHCELRVQKIPTSDRRLLRGSIVNIGQRKLEEAKIREHEAELAHVSRLAVMGEMVAGIAHEINQPLFAITNYAQASSRVLENESLREPELAAWSANIEREATRAAEIIRRLRSFTRKGEQPKSRVDVNEAVQEAVELMRLDARKHRVKLDTDLSEEPVFICGDLIGLQQVLVNLVRNAWEAMAKMEADNRIVTITTFATNTFVEISVIDNGPGFDEPDINQIFDTFYSTKSEGMGMGLAISRTLVESLGGKLIAKNRDGDQGAVLKISLPRLEGAIQRDVICSSLA